MARCGRSVVGRESPGETWRRNNQELRALIADREAFTNPRKTLEGMYVDGMTDEDAVGLTGDDLERFLDDAPFIDYVVVSYGTPIFWEATHIDGYTIANPPSKTTAGHRNLCPGYEPTRGTGWIYARQPDGTRRRIRKETT